MPASREGVNLLEPAGPMSIRTRYPLGVIQPHRRMGPRDAGGDASGGVPKHQPTDHDDEAGGKSAKGQDPTFPCPSTQPGKPTNGGPKPTVRLPVVYAPPITHTIGRAQQKPKGSGGLGADHGLSARPCVSRLPTDVAGVSTSRLSRVRCRVRASSRHLPWEHCRCRAMPTARRRASAWRDRTLERCHTRPRAGDSRS